MNEAFYHKTTKECNAIITKKYSTSFNLGIKLMGKKYQEGIYSLYGYVRLGDEIVDSFHEHDREMLLNEFEQDTYNAIERRISTNPVINSFQQMFHKYDIDINLLKAYLESMRMDLNKVQYDPELYHKYIYGSAEVVGLMCLKVFCDGNQEMYERLTDPAKSLGSALQKVNFLRDIKDDFEDKGRVYFPHLDLSNFSVEAKKQIEDDIRVEFQDALQGIKQLPDGSRIGVYLAYKYYLKLFRKIRRKNPQQVLKKRIRINNLWKLFILTKTITRYQLNIL